MKILELKYIDHQSGWNVQKVDFANLTLLVGASGVGKTRILNTLLILSRVANGRSYNGIEWSLKISLNNTLYVWSGEFETKESDYQEFLNFFEKDKEYKIKWEKLVKDGQTIFERADMNLFFNGKKTVKLDAAKSALTLLKEEDDVSPIYRAFRRVYELSEDTGSGIHFPSFNYDKSSLTLEEIRGITTITPSDKLFLLKKNNLPEFQEILDNFRNIFPLVEDLDFDMGNFNNSFSYPVLKMKEKNVVSWIYGISSGMWRTLNQIITLTMANDGDVILIDEFENGLGINCIDSLAENIMDPERDIQVIMTSHHPYIINNIPYSTWRVVTRKGSDVSIHTADELKIGKWSKHDAFIQLSNTKAFQTGEA